MEGGLAGTSRIHTLQTTNQRFDSLYGRSPDAFVQLNMNGSNSSLTVSSTNFTSTAPGSQALSVVHNGDGHSVFLSGLVVDMVG